MDRFDVISFADLTGPDGGEWVRIGGGSFGVVFKGEYLGTQVAIKEVLPNDTYDVEKYFERECVLMKEARHPNIVQYIGLTKSPGPDGRIYIISEFVGGNLRSYIADTRKPFDWPLRMSFATDIARALAYLHARNCMHRDLKGENLLITANDRIKVCDFGFARIAARNEDEMRRISYCGTDGYMSPEILLGVDFGLPSDIFSLGIIFCEIASRHLVDANVFKRVMPSFGIDADELHEMASPGCPSEFIQLALDCVEEEPENRPDMRTIIKRLRVIEAAVLAQADRNKTYHIGSVRGSSIQTVLGSRLGKGTGTARPTGPPRLPSFNGAVQIGKSKERSPSSDSTSSTGSADDEMDEAIAALEKVGIQTADVDDIIVVAPSPTKNAGPAVSTLKLTKANAAAMAAGGTFKVSGHGNPWWSDEVDDNGVPSLPPGWLEAAQAAKSHKNEASESSDSRRALLTSSNGADGESDYSTSVVRKSRIGSTHAPLRSTMSVLTARGHGDADADEGAGSNVTVRAARQTPSASADEALSAWSSSSRLVTGNNSAEAPTQSFMTARSHRADPSLAMATIGAASSIYHVASESMAEDPEPIPLYHRFTLVKNGMKRPASVAATASAAAAGLPSPASSLLPPAVMLANALARCSVCSKRIGWKPFLDCDDCAYKTHVGCGEKAEPTCLEMHIPPADKAVVTPRHAQGRGASDASNGGHSASPSDGKRGRGSSPTSSQPSRKSSSSSGASGAGGGGGILSPAAAALKAAVTGVGNAEVDKKERKKREKEAAAAAKREASSGSNAAPLRAAGKA